MHDKLQQQNCEVLHDPECWSSYESHPEQFHPAQQDAATSECYECKEFNHNRTVITMIGIETSNGFIDFHKTYFICQRCGKAYDDADDFYLNRIESNKSGITSVKCECGVKFYVTYNYRGDIVNFM